MDNIIGYIYEITNLINNKKYIGSRLSKTIDEKYWGSGKIIKLAIKKYGIENFDRKIIKWVYKYEKTDLNLSDGKFLKNIETQILSNLNVATDPIYYNIKNTGEGAE